MVSPIEHAQIIAQAYARFANQLYRPEAHFGLYENFRDALSEGQIQSKLAIIEYFVGKKLNYENGFFIGYWHGLLPYFFLKFGLVRQAHGIEIDSAWQDFASRILSGLSWQSRLHDAQQLNSADFSEIDLVVNTSCEHMDNQWIRAVPSGVVVVAQSNDYDIEAHTNPVKTLDQFKENLGLSKLIFSLEKDFGVYKRFTLIGKK